jgi:hypothetical protein
MEKSISKEAWAYYDRVIDPLIHRQVEKLNKGQSAYYEAWIDFEEFLQKSKNSKWWNYLYTYPNLAAYTAAKMIIRWDKWYASPSYVEMLNVGLKTIQP